MMKPASFLFCVDRPWTSRDGTARVSIELSKELARRGHRVESFSYDDVGVPKGRVGKYFQTYTFQKAVLDKIRRDGHKYDVVQMEHRLLRFPRERYGFDGQIIAKSNGLIHFFSAYQKRSVSRVRAQSLSGKFRVAYLAAEAGRRLAGLPLKVVEHGFREADAIHMLTNLEGRYVGEVLGFADKTTVIENGLSRERAAELSSVTRSDNSDEIKLVFVGGWGPRKGGAIMGKAFQKLQEAIPNTRLKILGSGIKSEEVLRDFFPENRDSIEVVESFEPDQLPGLLNGCHASWFPSFMEGMPLGVIELMQAGIPVVGYAAPGTTDLLEKVSCELIIRSQSIDELVSVTSNLVLDRKKLTELSQRSRKVASGMTWEKSCNLFLKSLGMGE